MVETDILEYNRDRQSRSLTYNEINEAFPGFSQPMKLKSISLFLRKWN
jgi:hypothetical protein